MKNYKYIGLFLLSLGLVSCDVNNELDDIAAEVLPVVELNTNGLDFSSYVSIGASFTAGYSDGALFIAVQENSFPNILAGKFGTDFTQPLMNDNIGGMVDGSTVELAPRLYFNGAGPARLPATPTTQSSDVISGPFNNMGVPGAKSFHLGVPGYGTLNPYFGRMASSPAATVLGDAIVQNPTFFTLSEIGGNDVLGYATSGGIGVDQTGNYDASSYGVNDITDPTVFAQVFTGMVSALTANDAKGVVSNVPYVTSLAYFTTVPYNPIPLDAGTATYVTSAYATYNGGLQLAQSYNMIDAAEVAKRTINFVEGQNAVVIEDEDLTDLSALGIPSYRQSTTADLIVLTASTFIGTLADPSNPASINGVGVALADKWVLTTTEQAKIKKATDAYNTTIETIVAANPNLALVDFKGILQEASAGIQFDEYVMNTSLVFGGLLSLDGVHLTSRGYALLANKILAAMDAEFGSNFTKATDGLAKANDYQTNYSPALR